MAAKIANFTASGSTYAPAEEAKVVASLLRVQAVAESLAPVVVQDYGIRMGDTGVEPSDEFPFYVQVYRRYEDSLVQTEDLAGFESRTDAERFLAWLREDEALDVLGDETPL